MLPEAGAFELIFLAMVALIVVGPKDLPVLLRKVGQFTAKMRGLASEFRASFDEMARQSELDELRKEVDALRSGQFAAGSVPGVEEHLNEINAHLTDSPPRHGTPPLPVLNAAQEPRPTDDVDPEPLLPFDGPAGEETYREEPREPRRRAGDDVEPAPPLPFDGPAGEEDYRETSPGLAQAELAPKLAPVAAAKAGAGA